jgi:hypothetical protein
MKDIPVCGISQMIYTEAKMVLYINASQKYHVFTYIKFKYYGIIVYSIFIGINHFF